MKGKTFKNWRSTYKDISRGYIKNLFKKYKSYILISKEIGDEQNVTSSFDNIRVNGGQVGKGFENKILKKCDLDLYVKSIDEILKRLPGMYKKIIIESFIRESSDISIYVDLGLPRSTYYYMKDEAIKMFIDDYIASDIYKI